MIETSRLKLVSFNKDYITDEYIGWLNNAQMMRYSEQRHFKHDYDTCLNYLNGFQNTQNIFAAILLKDSNVHIGNINVYIDVFNRVADLGILLGNENVQGQGLGSEAWFAVMCYLFEKRNVRKITAGTMASNLGMLKIMKKSCMPKESTSERHFLCSGLEVDLIRCALFKDDFDNLKQSDLVKTFVNNLLFTE